MKSYAKRNWLVMAVLMLALVLPLSAMAVDINDADDMLTVMTNTVPNRGANQLVIELKKDIDVSGLAAWEAPNVNSYTGQGSVVFKGNGHTITGMKTMLFSGTWAGKNGGLRIENLTLKDANIVVDKNDSVGTVGVGAFVGIPSSSGLGVQLINCHLVDSHVEGGHWTGGLVGTSDGYNGSDGPVFLELLIQNCSVVNSEIVGKGSVGGVIGHGARNAWTEVKITNTIVTGNTITSTGSSKMKAGDVLGTIGAAGTPSTTNGITKTGGIYVNATANDNDVTSGGAEINRIFGRGGSNGGMLHIVGGTYDTSREENSVIPDADSINAKVAVSGTAPVFLGEAKPAVPTYSAPQTGDNSQLLLWAGMMIVAVIGMVAFGKKRAATDR